MLTEKEYSDKRKKQKPEDLRELCDVALFLHHGSQLFIHSKLPEINQNKR